METIQQLNPVFLQFGPIRICWYGVIIGAGVILGLWLAVKESQRRGLEKDVFIDLVLWALPIAIISARLYYVLFSFDYYLENPSEIIKIWNGGIAIHGALIGAVITTVIFAKKRGLSFWKLADIAAPSIILGQAIGRWGNFINQEAYGSEVTQEYLKSFYLPDLIVNQMYINGQYHHPTFLYESIWSFVGFAILMLLRNVNLRQGQLFLTYVIYYSIGRFVIEGIRTDSLMLTESLRMAQVISVVLIVLAASTIIYRRLKGYSNQRYLDNNQNNNRGC